MFNFTLWLLALLIALSVWFYCVIFLLRDEHFHNSVASLEDYIWCWGFIKGIKYYLEDCEK